jgi:hypothetical protein
VDDTAQPGDLTSGRWAGGDGAYTAACQREHQAWQQDRGCSEATLAGEFKEVETKWVFASVLHHVTSGASSWSCWSVLLMIARPSTDVEFLADLRRGIFVSSITFSHCEG